MAQNIEKSLGLKSKKSVGGVGAFEVTYKGKLVFSKIKTKRFPKDEEVIKEIRRLKAGK